MWLKNSVCVCSSNREQVVCATSNPCLPFPLLSSISWLRASLSPSPPPCLLIISVSFKRFSLIKYLGLCQPCLPLSLSHSLSLQPSSLLSLVPGAVRASSLAECCCSKRRAEGAAQGSFPFLLHSVSIRTQRNHPSFAIFTALSFHHFSSSLPVSFSLCSMHLICLSLTMNPTVKIHLQNGTQFNTYMYQVGTHHL